MRIGKIYEVSYRGLGKFLDFTIANPWKTLIAATVATIVLGYWGFNIPLRTNLEDLFPETTPHVVRAKATRDKMTSSSQVLMVLSSPDKDANLRFLLELVKRFETNPLIGSIEYKKDISFFKKNALLFVEQKDLEDLDAKLKKTIKRAVEEDLDPLADQEEEEAGAAKPDSKPVKAEKVEFDDGFGDKEDADQPKGEAKEAAAAKPDSKPMKAQKAEFDDGFGDTPEADEPKGEADQQKKAGPEEGQKKAAEQAPKANGKGTAEQVAEEEGFEVPSEHE